jgi:hypothetical protein
MVCCFWLRAVFPWSTSLCHSLVLYTFIQLKAKDRTLITLVQRIKTDQITVNQPDPCHLRSIIRKDNTFVPLKIAVFLRGCNIVKMPLSLIY